ncbi:glycosyltransferase family 1 protein [Skermania sp. ID1734]|uniref:glycosyltransferase n=1 Tax=Skermania sp. ID1734 TaxID=2597516 RepID=UPI00117F8616|nr:glycosyltransferase [Skermania sp. ID1734]TSD99582.1 glycosyltransferase family 1 protein [Skermania sp. ID1734]
MKIAMISEHASPLAALGGVDAGGQNVHVAELSAALARRGHDVVVYTRRDDPDLPEEVETEQGYTVVHVPAGPARYLPKDLMLEYMGDFGSYLLDRWSEERPDVAHAHFWMSGLATQLAARPRSIAMIQTFHALGVVKRRYQGSADTSPPDRIRLERLIARGATRIAATCSDEVFELARMGVPRSRTSVVPCGVDVQKFTPADEPERPVSKDLHRLVSVGRLVPRKGFDIGIAALAKLPDTELVIAGGPPAGGLEDDAEARRLRMVAERFGVQDRVRMLGQVPHDEMPALLRSADAVLCTPWYEPFGIVPLEAMACGRPVIASAVGGMLDTVVDGVTGCLVPPRNPDRVADAVRGLFADSSRRIGFGIAGYDRAKSRYSWDRVALDTVRVYKRALPAAMFEDPKRSHIGVNER